MEPAFFRVAANFMKSDCTVLLVAAVSIVKMQTASLEQAYY